MSKQALTVLYLVFLLGTSSFPGLTCPNITKSYAINAQQLPPQACQQTVLLGSVSEGTMLWNHTYGATSDEEVRAIIQTTDDGFVLTGWTASLGAGGGDGWLVKTDSAGVLQWERTYGGAATDVANLVIPTTDGGFALAGSTWSFGAGGVDAWLVKTDEGGVFQWMQTYGDDANDGAHSITQTPDDGFALAAWTTSSETEDIDGWLIKTDANGAEEWTQTYGGAATDELWSVIPTGDAGYVLVGFTSSYGAGQTDAWVIKTDVRGVLQWTRTYGDVNSDFAWIGIPTMDNGFAFAGSTNSSGAGGTDGWLVKTDVNGIPQWNRTYGGSENDVIYSVVQTTDHGFALAGVSKSSGTGYEHFWLVKTDPNGVPQWMQIYDMGRAKAKSVIQTTDGGFALAGVINSSGVDTDAWLVKTVPILPDTTPPFLSPSSNITYTEGATGYFLNWTVADLHPGTYWFYNNSVLVDSGRWENGTLSWSVEGLAPGAYNFTLVVQDLTGNNASSTIWVTVKAPLFWFSPRGLLILLVLAALVTLGLWTKRS